MKTISGKILYFIAYVYVYGVWLLCTSQLSFIIQNLKKKIKKHRISLLPPLFFAQCYYILRGVSIYPSCTYVHCVYIFIYCSISNWGHNIQGGCGYYRKQTNYQSKLLRNIIPYYVYTQRNVLLLCFCYCLKPLLVNVVCCVCFQILCIVV